MTILLSQELTGAGFPVFGIPPSKWEGASFVGDVVRARGELRQITLTYLDAIDGSTMGVCVSNLDGRAHHEDPIAAHLTNFVVRFDPEFLMKRVKRQRFEPVQEGDFGERALTAAIAGEQLGATLLSHRELPLQLLRTAVRRGGGVTDLGIVAWRLDVRAHAASVEQVDAGFAADLDAVAEES